LGSDNEALATSRRAPSSVVTPRRTRQAKGKVPTSRAAATIAATQTAEAKKKKWKQTRSTVSVDTTMVSSGVETIEDDDEEGDTELPSKMAAPSVGTPHKAASTEEQAVETPRQTSVTQERLRSSADTMGDLRSHKRARKAPPKPCKPGLKSATK
jgi:hypothetical protein